MNTESLLQKTKRVGRPDRILIAEVAGGQVTCQSEGWESKKHTSWGMLVEDFRNEVATDGSLLGVSDRRSACGWSVVMLDHHKKMHGMNGTLDAKLELQRAIKRAELTTFCVSFDGLSVPSRPMLTKNRFCARRFTTLNLHKASG